MRKSVNRDQKPVPLYTVIYETISIPLLEVSNYMIITVPEK